MAPITPTHALWPGTLESKYSEYQLTSPVSSLLLLPQEPSEPVNKNEEAGGFVKGGTPACLLSRGRTTACRCARTARASARPTPAPRAGRCGGAAPARRPTLGRATPTASPARCAPPPAARARPVCKGLGSRRGRRVLARARARYPQDCKTARAWFFMPSKTRAANGGALHSESSRFCKECAASRPQ